MEIKVDHRSIRVEGILQADHDHRGMFNEPEGTIEVATDQPPAEQAETLIHELLHAIWSSRHMKARLTEESAVTQLASGLATVLRDNPLLPQLLLGALVNGEDLPLG